jgi:hypothetical protein
MRRVAEYYRRVERELRGDKRFKFADDDVCDPVSQAVAAPNSES